mgnify:CR=1 FL=1
MLNTGKRLRNLGNCILGYLELPNGVPSHDTIQRVMATIEPEVTEVLLTKWMELKISGEDKKGSLSRVGVEKVRQP